MIKIKNILNSFSVYKFSVYALKPDLFIYFIILYKILGDRILYISKCYWLNNKLLKIGTMGDNIKEMNWKCHKHDFEVVLLYIYECTSLTHLY